VVIAFHGNVSQNKLQRQRTFPSKLLTISLKSFKLIYIMGCTIVDNSGSKWLTFALRFLFYIRNFCVWIRTGPWRFLNLKESKATVVIRKFVWYRKLSSYERE
jgi:hypothetical protein